MSLRKADLLKILLRSFFIQSSWNYKGMMNLGFAFSLIPLFRPLKFNREERADFLRRHLGFFNANPFLSTLILGSVARLEEEHASKGEPGPDRIGKVKSSLCGPVGSLGDQLFWGALRPAAAALGVICSLVWWGWGALALLVSFNLPHLYIRCRGLFRGYNLGFGVVREISSQFYPRLAGTLGRSILFMAGFIISYRFFESTAIGLTAIVALFTSIVLGLFLIGREFPLHVAMSLFIAAGIVIELLRG